MKHFYIYILLTVILAVSAVSCRIEEPEFQQAEDQEIIPVTVSLQLEVAPEDNGTPGTKAVDDPASVASTQIQNMCVIQFNGTGLDAKQRGEVHYLRADVDPEDENYLDFGKIKLAYSEGQPQTLVFLANTFMQLPGQAGVTTLGEVLNLWHVAGGEASVFGHDGQGEGFPNDVTYYQRMSALAVTEVDNGIVVHGVWRRSMARINVEIVNTAGIDNLKIVSAQLRNVSQKDYYVTDYSYIDSWSSWSDYTTDNLISDPFQDVYNPNMPLRTDYNPRAWTSGGGTAGGTGTANFTWYVPSNMRGIDTSNLSKQEKNLCLNAYAATYLYIVASYGASDEPILYRFYLGENLVNDFNLKPNTSYSYRLTFNGKGNATTDKRVEDLGTRKFEYDANCYIINPSPLGDRYFSFNVVHRPNIFWGNPYNEGVRFQSVYDVYPSNFISSTEYWHARVIWSDYPYEPSEIAAMMVNKTGKGDGNYDDDRSRVKIKIPSNIKHGNIVIGIFANDAEDDFTTNANTMLWSWHLWITDYQPDRIIGHTPTAGTYVYNVEGGQVHRYSESIPAWSTGAYKNGYIMDRNCGALDRNYHGNSRGGGFYYQFGRKDPLSADYTGYYYDYACTTRYSVAYNPGPSNENYGYMTTSSIGQGGKNVPYSVMKPRRYLVGEPWHDGDGFAPTNIVWNDPKIGEKTAQEEAGKSIFDPCPPGWKVPTHVFIGNLKFGSTSTTDPAVNLVWQGHGFLYGITYYPAGYLDNKDNPEPQAAFFPGQSNRLTGYGYNGNMYYQIGDRGSYWTSTPYSTTQAAFFTFSTTSASISGNSRACALQLRCIRE